MHGATKPIQESVLRNIRDNVILDKTRCWKFKERFLEVLWYQMTTYCSQFVECYLKNIYHFFLTTKYLANL